MTTEETISSQKILETLRANLSAINATVDHQEASVVTEVGDGTSVVEVKLVQESLNPLGMAHGGLIFTLCDVATGVAARTGGRITVTLDSSIQFLRPGKDTSKLVAHGRVVKEGRTTGLVTAEVFNDAGELLATASVMVYYVDENTYADETMQ